MSDVSSIAWDLDTGELLTVGQETPHAPDFTTPDLEVQFGMPTLQHRLGIWTHRMSSNRTSSDVGLNGFSLFHCSE
jgi:hypothetical protein